MDAGLSLVHSYLDMVAGVQPTRHSPENGRKLRLKSQMLVGKSSKKPT